MTTTRKSATAAPRKRLLALLLLPLTLILSACHIDSEIKVESATDMTWVFTFDTQQAGAGASSATVCDSIKPQLAAFDAYGTTTVEPLDGAVGIGCKVTLDFNESMVSYFLTKSGDTYTFDIPSYFWSSFDSAMNSSSGGNLGDFTLNFKVTFPERVTEVSSGGVIDGNTAYWTSYNDMMAGTRAVAGGSSLPSDDPSNFNTPSSDETPDSPRFDTTEPAVNGGPKTENNKDDDGGFPMWAWFAIGGGALLLIGGTAFAVSRKKKNNGGNPPFGGQPGPYAPNAYGQPQYGAPSAPTAPMSASQYDQLNQQYPNPNGEANPWTMPQN